MAFVDNWVVGKEEVVATMVVVMATVMGGAVEDVL